MLIRIEPFSSLKPKSLQFERLIFCIVEIEHYALPWTTHFDHHLLLSISSYREAGFHMLDEALYLQTPTQDQTIPFNRNANNPR